MLKFNRTHKRLVIPAGINPNYGIDSSALYNTSDADAKPEDILAGITAYSDNGKIVGTLDVEAEKEESFNEGVQVQKSKLESISITENGSYSREDGWNEVIVDVPDLNGDYNEGLEDGIEIGKAEIIDGMNDATITANAVLEGYIGYGKDNERIVGTNVGGFDFSEIGYSATDNNNANKPIKDDIAYSKTLYDAWDPNNTSAASLYTSDSSMVYAPNIDTSNVTNMNRMFQSCRKLSFVPLLNTSKVTNMTYMFYYCSRLTTVPQLDTTKVTSMGGMFNNCASLTTVPQLDTTKVTNMDELFYQCSNLTTVPELNCQSITNMPTAYYYAPFYGCPKLESFGGFKDLGKTFTGTASKTFYMGTNNEALTRESMINTFNALYDLTTLSYTGTATFWVSRYAYDKLLEEDISIATTKGWVISRYNG